MTIPVEREIKLSAHPGYALPDLRDLGDGAVRDHDVELLESVYWDTGSLEVARRGYGLRHRHRRDMAEDLGIWTLKTPGRMEGDRVVRGEREVSGASDVLPALLLDLLPSDLDRGDLHPVAVLHARRRVLGLSAGGAAGVEVMDDTVDVLNAEGRVVERFRELEVEVLDGGDDLADRVAARLRAAGAGPPESGSKYRRALGALGYPVSALGDLSGL
jgi:inorganic triphosphatase YgiF